MRQARFSLICLLFLCLVALITGCGTTTNGSSGGGSDGSFTLTASASVSVAQGQAGTFTVTPQASDGFSGSVQISISGLPTGVTLTPASATATPGQATTFTVTASSSAPVGAANLVVQGISGNLNARTAVELTVTAASTTPTGAGDFSLTASPTTVSLTQGQTAQVVVSSAALNGFSGNIALAISNLPDGVTASPATLTLSPGNPVTVNLTASATATPTAAAQAVSFVGTSGALSHTLTEQVSVVAAVSTTPDFSIIATPTTIPVAQGGQSNIVSLSVVGVNGFSGNVAVSFTGLPAGVTTIPPSIAALQTGQSEPVVFVAANNAPLGTSTITLTATSGALTHAVTITLSVTTQPPADFVGLALSPTSETVYTGSVNTVSVTATATEGYSGPISVTVQGLPHGVTASPASATLTPGVAQTFTLAATSAATTGNATVTFLAQLNSLSATANLALTVATPTSSGTDVPTWHFDNARDGLNASETTLTPATVGPAIFGRLKSASTDGAVDAQPLYLSNLTIGSAVYDVLFAVTENDSVYAWDANTGTVLWRSSALQTGETAADNQGCGELPTQVGIAGTPVIDRNYGADGAIFFVSKSKDSSGAYHQRLHALDLTTGSELSGSPVNIPAIAGTVNSFSPAVAVDRAALLLQNGVVYVGWTSPCQESSTQYGGWVMAYDEGSLTQLSALDLTPNGSGGDIGMSGAGPAADMQGNIYLVTAKGTFDTTLNGSRQPATGDYGNGYVKLQMTNGALAVADYFEPLSGVPDASDYANQGSGGPILTDPFAVGQQTLPPILLGAGQDGNIYLMAANGSSPLGEYNGTSNKNTDTLTGALPNGASSSPAYFNGSFFYAGASDSAKAFSFTSGGAVTSRSASTMGSAGATPVISANGTSTPILWVLDTSASGGPVLHAYDATNLATELYNSTMAASDAVGPTGATSVPMVVNGNVYVGTQRGVVIYGPMGRN